MFEMLIQEHEVDIDSFNNQISWKKIFCEHDCKTTLIKDSLSTLI